MATCTNCAAQIPAGARFCPACGTAVSALTAPQSAAPRDERKVVSALFCDLVGFTSISETADPEDIDRMLDAYASMARSRIEAFGGVVEKFIGDAVVGVFGVPAAHEDDPERAVRAALRIAADAADLAGVAGAPLRLRIGINTGEALVRLGIATGIGERFIAGDAINTAARIQSVAPEMGVAVGLSTYEATRQKFDYDELPPAVLKGKTEPVRVFHAVSSRSRLGSDLTRSQASAFVGREAEHASLVATFDRTIDLRHLHMVTIVGEPGIGKSRMVAELRAYVDARPELVSWHQGRCLPYGDGVTFWALGEIVKARTGILESDDPLTAAAKLDDALPPGQDREWLRQRLGALVGVEAASPAAREESFAAWAAFITAMAANDPAVIVIEDIHWADDAMLAFLEDLVAGEHHVPLLVVATARPELFERHAGFGVPGPSVARLNLGALSDADTRELIAGLLGTAVPTELHGPIVERADGNPLYAEEYVRLLTDRDLVETVGGSVTLRPGVDLPLPDTIQALIAARLDALPQDRKVMLSDAAVVGKVFWDGAVADMGSRPRPDVRAAMDQLGRIELVRPARRSSMAGEREYAFWHALARDVSYAQLPRGSRAERHAVAAHWLEAKAGDRVEDIAEVLAHHWTTALDLARAAGQAGSAEEFAPNAVRFLRLAGDRALGLDTMTAVAMYERALGLLPPDHPDRADIQLRFARAAFEAARHAEAITAAEEAARASEAGNDPVGTARALMLLSQIRSWFSEPDAPEIAARAVELLEPLGPSADLVAALVQLASTFTGTGRPGDGLARAQRALDLAMELGLPPQPRALGARAWARASLGDLGGFEDWEQAIALGEAAGLGAAVATMHGNYGTYLSMNEGNRRALPVTRAGLEKADARGLRSMALFLSTNLASILLENGALDEALLVVEERLGPAERSGDHPVEATLLQTALRARIWQGDAAAMTDLLPALERLDELAEGPDSVGIFPVVALARLELGDPGAAAVLITRIEAFEPIVRMSGEYWSSLSDMVRVTLRLDSPDRAERLLEGANSTKPGARHARTTAQASIAEARGEFQEAAATYDEAAAAFRRTGFAGEEALALLGRGRCLLRLGRAAEAVPALRDARELFERMGAAPSIAEVDALLQGSAPGRTRGHGGKAQTGSRGT